MRWWARTIRLFAVISLVYVIAGIYFLSLTVRETYLRGPDLTTPYYDQVFYARSAVNLLFLVGLLVGSVFLWRLRRRGLLICNVVFGGEILYLLLCNGFEICAWLSGGTIGLIAQAMGAAGGTGEMGTAAQMITGYPLIALLVLNLAYYRLRQANVLPRAGTG